MSHRHALTLCALPVLLAVGVNHAGGQSATGGKYAFLVGVHQYDPEELRPLKYAESDVAALAEMLRDRGYRRAQVVLMTHAVGTVDANLMPTCGNVRAQLRRLLRKLTPTDTLLIALAGHGVQFKGDEDSYFCPLDAKLSDRSTLISMAEIYRELDRCGAGFKLLLVDACRNDPQAMGARSGTAAKLESVTRPQKAILPGGTQRQ